MLIFGRKKPKKTQLAASIRNIPKYYEAVRNFGKCFLLPIDLLIGLRLDDKRFIRFFDKYSETTVIKL